MNALRLSAIAWLLTCVSIAGAQTQIGLRAGWAGKERAGRWNLLTIRASSASPKNVTLRTIVPGPAGFASVISQDVAIGPAAKTFELFAPSHYSPWEQRVLVVSDGRTGRTLGQYPAGPKLSPPQTPMLGPQGIFVGVSGMHTALEAPIQAGLAAAAYLPPRLLPRAWVGYDSLDVLYLNQPGPIDLDVDQQTAILDWVRAGGSLLLAPGENASGFSGQLTAALPCRIGAVIAIDVPTDLLKKAGIDQRFAHLAARQLVALPSGRRFELIPGAPLDAWSARYGLGRIMVAPIDVASLEFTTSNPTQHAIRFWKPLLARLTYANPPRPKRSYAAPYYGYQSESEDQEREGAALASVCDYMSAAPAPRHGAPLVFLGVMLVIGPLDSLVLFALKRRHWTWTTIAGWIGALGASALCVAAVARPNKVRYQTVRVIDQAGNHTVATTDLIALSSAAGETYALHQAEGPSGWWQAVDPAGAIDMTRRPQPDARFHETDQRATPRPIATLAGQVRYLRCDRAGSRDPLLDVSLKLKFGPSHSPRLIGTIRNLSTSALKQVRIRTRLGVVDVPLGAGGRLLPRQAVAVDLAAVGAKFAPQKIEDRYQDLNSFHAPAAPARAGADQLWDVAPDLAGRRSLRMDDLIGETNDYACVYARCVDVAAPADLRIQPPAIETHDQWVRALVPLGS